MMMPTPPVLQALIDERQDALRPSPPLAGAARGRGLRARIGHLLIMAGVALGGEPIESPTEGRRAQARAV